MSDKIYKYIIDFYYWFNVEIYYERFIKLVNFMFISLIWDYFGSNLTIYHYHYVFNLFNLMWFIN